jgi:hypothetical protein
VSDYVALALLGGAVCGLLSLWLVLRFLWRVYTHGGAEDMRKAASAVREARWPVLPRKLPPGEPDHPEIDPGSEGPKVPT